MEKKTQLKGYNSFVAPYPYYEFQFDLFFINDLENQKIRVGTLMIDIFTKYMLLHGYFFSLYISINKLSKNI